VPLLNLGKKMAARERHLMGSPDPEDDMELNEKVMIFIVMASEIFSDSEAVRTYFFVLQRFETPGRMRAGTRYYWKRQ